jgi:hypothetical protein
LRKPPEEKFQFVLGAAVALEGVAVYLVAETSVPNEDVVAAV